MLDKRLIRPPERSEAALCLPLCTVWSRSGCPWPPSSESSRCRAASRRLVASWSCQTPQRTWLWSLAECNEAQRGRLVPTWMWCHCLKGSRPWIMWSTKRLFFSYPFYFHDSRRQKTGILLIIKIFNSLRTSAVTESSDRIDARAKNTVRQLWKTTHNI